MNTTSKYYRLELLKEKRAFFGYGFSCEEIDNGSVDIERDKVFSSFRVGDIITMEHPDRPDWSSKQWVVQNKTKTNYFYYSQQMLVVTKEGDECIELLVGAYLWVYFWTKIYHGEIKVQIIGNIYSYEIFTMFKEHNVPHIKDKIYHYLNTMKERREEEEKTAPFCPLKLYSLS